MNVERSWWSKAARKSVGNWWSMALLKAKGGWERGPRGGKRRRTSGGGWEYWQEGMDEPKRQFSFAFAEKKPSPPASHPVQKLEQPKPPEPEPKKEPPKPVNEEDARRMHVREQKERFAGYRIKPYLDMFAKAARSEKEIKLGQGLFGRAFIDHTFKDKEGRNQKCVVKYGTMSDMEVEVARKLGDLGISPVVFDHHESYIGLDDPRLKQVDYAIQEARDSGALKGEAYYDDEAGEDIEEDHPKAVPDHDTEDRKKVFSDFIKDRKDFIKESKEKAEDIRIGIKNLTEEIDNLQEQIDKMDAGRESEEIEDRISDLWSERHELEFKLNELNEIDIGGLDDEVVNAVSEAGVYHSMAKIDEARRFLKRTGRYAGEYKIGSRIAMEYLDGFEPLDDYLESYGVSDADDILSRMKVGISLMSVLNRMHRAGYSHNDLHDMNIMHNGDEAKLIDFGLAEEFGQGKSNTQDHYKIRQTASNVLSFLDELDFMMKKTEGDRTAEEQQAYLDASGEVRRLADDVKTFISDKMGGGMPPHVDGDVQEYVLGVYERVDKLGEAYRRMEELAR